MSLPRLHLPLIFSLARPFLAPSPVRATLPTALLSTRVLHFSNSKSKEKENVQSSSRQQQQIVKTGEQPPPTSAVSSDALLQWLAGIAGTKERSRLTAAECASELQDFIVTVGSVDSSPAHVGRVFLHFRRLMHRRLASKAAVPIPSKPQAQPLARVQALASEPGHAVGEVRDRLLSAASPSAPSPADVDGLLAALTLAAGDALHAALLHGHGQGQGAGLWIGPSWVSLPGQERGSVLALRIRKKVKESGEVSLDDLVSLLHAFGLPLSHPLWDTCARMATGWALAGTVQRGTTQAAAAQLKLGRADELLRVAFDSLPAMLRSRLEPCMHLLLPTGSQGKEKEKGSVLSSEGASPPWLLLSVTPEAGTGGQTVHVTVAIRGQGQGEGEEPKFAVQEQPLERRSNKRSKADRSGHTDASGAASTLPAPPPATKAPREGGEGGGDTVQRQEDTPVHVPSREDTRTAAQALIHSMRTSPMPETAPLERGGSRPGAEGQQGEGEGLLGQEPPSVAPAPASSGAEKRDGVPVSVAHLLQEAAVRGPRDPSFLLHALHVIRHPLDLAWSNRRGGAGGGGGGQVTDREAALVAQRTSKRLHPGLLAGLSELCKGDAGRAAARATPVPTLAQLMSTCLDALREEAYVCLAQEQAESSSSSTRRPSRFPSHAALYLRTSLLCADILAERGYDSKVRGKQQYCTRIIGRLAMAVLATRELCLGEHGARLGREERANVLALLQQAGRHRLLSAAIQALPGLQVLTQGTWSPREAVEVGRALTLYLHAMAAVSCPPQGGSSVFSPLPPLPPIQVWGRVLGDGGGAQAHALLQTGQAHEAAHRQFWLQPDSHGCLLSICERLAGAPGPEGVGGVQGGVLLPSQGDLERVRKALRDVAVRVFRMKGGGQRSKEGESGQASSEDEGPLPTPTPAPAPVAAPAPLTGQAKLAWDRQYPTLPGQEALLLAQDLWALGVPLSDTVWAGLSVNAVATHTWGGQQAGQGRGDARTWPCIRPDTREDKAALDVLKEFAAWHKVWRSKGRAVALAARARAGEGAGTGEGGPTTAPALDVEQGPEKEEEQRDVQQ